MTYEVKLGDSLSSIAAQLLGDESRWPELAQLNGLSRPDQLLVGQQLEIPAGQSGRGAAASGTQNAGAQNAGARQPAQVPANYYLFVLADEANPLRGKVIRRVLVNPKLTAAAATRLGRPLTPFPHPERFGFTPSAPGSILPAGRHATGMKPSPYLSASRLQPLGARRFTGSPFWIDEAKARAAGATFHEVDDIVADLERIRAKSVGASNAKLAELIGKVRADREVLIRGTVPAAAVKGPLAMGATRALQGVQIVGFAMTAVDMTHAAERSYDRHSVKPLAAETIRQAGGWAAAWAGIKLGAAGGALVGIESGPGAVATGAVGGILGGIAGYYGFDWIADHIDRN